MTDWERLLEPVPWVDGHDDAGSGSPVGGYGIVDLERVRPGIVWRPEMFEEYNRGVRRAVMANRTRDAGMCCNSGCVRKTDGRHIECWTCRHQ